MLLRRINAGRGADAPIRVAPLLEELARIRAQGYARSEGSVVPDTAMLAMALPVPAGHRPLALGVSGPLDRMRRNSQEILAAMRWRIDALRPASAEPTLPRARPRRANQDV